MFQTIINTTIHGPPGEAIIRPKVYTLLVLPVRMLCKKTSQQRKKLIRKQSPHLKIIKNRRVRRRPKRRERCSRKQQTFPLESFQQKLFPGNLQSFGGKCDIYLILLMLVRITSLMTSFGDIPALACRK